MTEDEFPKHAASLHLNHNDHKAVYDPIDRWVAENDHYEWVSEEQKQKALATDSVWTLQWYPDTPIGFYSICGADLVAVLARAKEVEEEDRN